VSLGVRAALALALGLAGCNSIPFEQRDWVAVRTAHYDIVSSIGDDETERLAVELERFRGAVGYFWGGALPAEPVRTRVYAFDDRNMPRKFAYQHQRSFLLARQRGDVIVLRAGGGWQDDAWTELKLAYARRLLWNASAEVPPPWLDEGLPQLASTVEIRGNRAVVGSVRDDHVEKLHETPWIPFERLLAATDLAGWSSRDRDILEAESWAICHYLWFGVRSRVTVGHSVAHFRDLLREGTPPAEAANTALGGPPQGSVYQHVVSKEFQIANLNLLLRGGAPSKRAVSTVEVLTELGALSLAIGESAQARGYLERAIEREPGSARALAALGDVLAAESDFAGAEQRYREALAADAADASSLLGLANLFAAQAHESTDGAQRAELVHEARDLYAKSRALAGDLPEADAGLAATYLLAGESPALGREALRSARAALPGDRELARLEVRLAIAAGDSGAARRIAEVLLTRARGASELETAQALLDQIGVRAAATTERER
jgi:tetratricopeptide (TPR) repeat protein